MPIQKTWTKPLDPDSPVTPVFFGDIIGCINIWCLKCHAAIATELHRAARGVMHPRESSDLYDLVQDVI